LGLHERLLRAVREEGYETPTPIQAQAIPHALKGRDLFGAAQTGTGKTAAFVLPILQRLLEAPAPSDGRRRVRALVLSPTRELASQIGDGFAALGRHTGLVPAVIFGGVGQGPQVQALRRGLDVLVAAPGRLGDLMNQGHVDLSAVEVLVLDEADRMLDQGFLPAVRRVIAKLPQKRQTLFFSATMPKELEPLAAQILRDPVRVEVARVATTAERVVEELYHVSQAGKRDLLEHLLRDPSITRAVVFTRTKHGADRVARHLEQAGVRGGAIHGNKSQGARERALGGFKDGVLRVLVATDVAARGIDIDGVSHVINYDLPTDAEAYVHRIGRTARAGAAGKAMSFCCEEEQPKLQRIERLIRRRVPVTAMPALTPRPAAPQGKPAAQQGKAPSRGSAEQLRTNGAQHLRQPPPRSPRPGGGSRPGGAPRAGGSRPGGERATGERRAPEGQRSRGERGPR
jgi:ATP-dependent RNA helicase RhlE